MGARFLSDGLKYEWLPFRKHTHSERVTTAANVHDVTPVLLQGAMAVYANAGYVGVHQREKNQSTPVDGHIALCPGQRKALPDTPEGTLQESLEYLKTKVEHPFQGVKNRFQHKTRYCGLAKNTAQRFGLFKLANLLLAKRHLMPVNGMNPS